MTFKLEFDENNLALAALFGKALSDYAANGGPMGSALPTRGDRGEGVRSVTAAELEAASIEAGKPTPESLGSSLPGSSDTAPDVGKSALAATETNSTEGQAGTQSDGAGSASLEKATYDTKGVPFIPAICAVAAKPFYASGKYAGQWKKGTKVEQAEYDRVYASALAQVIAGQQQGKQIIGEQVNTQTSVGATIEQSAAAKVFETPIDEVIKEQPANANDVFSLYGVVCALGENATMAANATCSQAGIENGTLIFSRPDLVDELFASLTQLKIGLQAAGA